VVPKTIWLMLFQVKAKNQTQAVVVNP